MTYRSPTLLTVIAGLAFTVVASAGNAADQRAFSVEFSSGAEYDSNVAVLDLDTSTSEGDIAAKLSLGLGYEKNLSRRLQFNIGYDVSQSLYQEFDAFDLLTQRGSTGMSYDFGPLKAGATFHYADAELDDEHFLTLKHLSPYVSRLFGRTLFLRAGYARLEKDYPTSPERNATADAPTLDVFFLLDGARRFVSVGAQHKQEDAFDDQYDYDGATLKLQLSHRFDNPDRDVTFKLGVNYEGRDYRNPFGTLGAPREDDRYRAEAGLEVALFRKGFLRFSYKYADYRSNLASVNFDEHVAAVELGASF